MSRSQLRRRAPWLRLGALLLAALHFVVSTDVGFAALDWLAPAVKSVAVADFPCAEHDCCCKSREECAKHCCCFPNWAAKGIAAPAGKVASAGKSAAAGKLVTVHISAAKKCRGEPAKAAREAASKLVCVVIGAGLPLASPAVAEQSHRSFVGIRPEEPQLEGPGKVPLAGALVL